MIPNPHDTAAAAEDANAQCTETAHTPEPWHVTLDCKTKFYADWLLASHDGAIIARLFLFGEEDALRETNARRIVACVNACKDWPTETLEAWAADPKSPLLTHQITDRDATIAALRARCERLETVCENVRLEIKWASRKGRPIEFLTRDLQRINAALAEGDAS